MKNFAMLGVWHVHARDYARHITSFPGCSIKYVWDRDEAAAAQFAQQWGGVYAPLETVLSDPEVEGLVVTTATSDHPDILVKAAKSGKALFTEKVLTLRTEDALRVKQAVLENKTRFAISLPHLSRATVHFAFDAAKSGKLGKINYARVRNVHDGAVADWLPPHFYDPVPCGGGAMIDLGAHPMYLLCALLGEPVRVTSSFTTVTKRAVEDNAVSLLTFPDGAIGVSETGFVSRFCPFTLEIGGDKGYLVVRGNELTWCCPDTDGKSETLTLTDDGPLPIRVWATDMEIPDEIGIDAAVRLTRVMEAAYSDPGASIAGIPEA